LSGQETDQTAAVRSFAAQLKATLQVPLYWQDEALTSKQANVELEAKGKPFAKGDVDALAACYILQDFLDTSTRAKV
jgi:putative Holliday junction resolvase